MSKADRNRRYYERHREQILAKAKSLYAAQGEKVRARVRAYRERNPDRVRRSNRQSYWKHRSTRLQRIKQWRIENIDAVYDARARRRMRRAQFDYAGEERAGLGLSAWGDEAVIAAALDDLYTKLPVALCTELDSIIHLDTSEPTYQDVIKRVRAYLHGEVV